VGFTAANVSAAKAQSRRGDATQDGYLRGPSDADFDLYLYKWNGYDWELVARSTSATSSESIDYDGSDGYFYWEVSAYSGRGSFDVYVK
jgi:hypothetical protein